MPQSPLQTSIQHSTPSTTLLTTIFWLSYFLFPPFTSPLNTLKQCLHFDPDSKPCLTLHCLLKSLDRSFAQLTNLEQSENWSGVVKLLTAKGSAKHKGEVVMQYEDALHEHTARAKVLPPQLAHWNAAGCDACVAWEIGACEGAV
jgi:DnaJ family protein C protein 3